MSTADTFRRTGNFVDRKSYRAGILATHAGNATFLLPTDLDKTKTVEPSIDGAQRTKILAKGAVNFYGKQKDYG